MSVFMHPIYTATVGAGGLSQVLFNNIPQGYTDLYVAISVRDTVSANTVGWGGNVRFNGETITSTTAYSNTVLYGDGSIAAAYREIGSASVRTGYVSTSVQTANSFAINSLYVSNYSSGNFKATFGEGSAATNGSSVYMMLTSGLYRNTAPITSLAVIAGANPLAENTTVTLYGIGQKYSGGTPTAPTIGTVTDQAEFASVSFTPASGDQASSYAVTSTPTSATTYGSTSPIVTPAPLNTSYVYKVSAVNDRGIAASADSSPITTSNSFVSLGTVYASSGTISSAVFNNIPQNYKHLQIRAFTRGGSTTFAAGLSLYVQFNNDGTAANYTVHGLYSEGSSANPSGVISAGTLSAQQAIPDVSATANAYGAMVIDVVDYANTSKYKTAKYIGGYDRNGGGRAMMYGGQWASFAPVTSIYVGTDGNFAQYSHIALYGMA